MIGTIFINVKTINTRTKTGTASELGGTAQIVQLELGVSDGTDKTETG